MSILQEILHFHFVTFLALQLDNNILENTSVFLTRPYDPTAIVLIDIVYVGSRTFDMG